MTAPERSVLHVLPHPGGGGETYVDLLDDMPGYRFERLCLTGSSAVAPARVARGVAEVFRRARGFDLVHVHGEVAAGLCLPVLAMRPSVVTLHGLHLVRRATGMGRTAARLNLRALLHAADRTICVSQSEHDVLVSVVGAAGARRAVVIRNGVHLPDRASSEERSGIRASLGITLPETVAIWVGSLDERKDPLAAVRAAGEAAVTLLVVGDGHLRAEVERAVSGHVRVLGRRSDVGHLLAAADIFVLTSRREGLAFSLLEAMAHGLAVVVTDLAENREAVGEAGIAVKPNDESVSSALRHLAADADARADLGARALQRVCHLFDAAEMRQRTQALYGDVLSGGAV